MQNEKARFVERKNCISCDSDRLIQLSAGQFKDEPLHSFIENDPWGESPLPYVADEKWILVHCANCSTHFHRRILAPEWIERCYREWVTQEAMEKFLATQDTSQVRFDKGRQHVSHVLRLEKLTRAIRQGNAVRVLDFGCGWGGFLSMCACFGFDGYGIDFSPDRRKQGQVSIYPGIEDLTADLQQNRDFFHAVSLFEVLEHLADPLDVLKSLHELMVPEAVLILETPDCTGVDGIRSMKDYRAIHPLSHINAFTPQSLSRIAQSAGFRPIDRGEAQVTCDLKSVIKTETKRALRRHLKPTTQQYFRKK